MSEVYRARDTVIGRTVAIKILTEAGCGDADAKARFLQEARLAGNIEHDNVISIYDFGEDHLQRPYMVMEFLRGVDLRHAIRDGHLGDLQARLRIAIQIARALGYIHSLDIIHRDIKPENIHLTTNGVVKLMDFGIAKTQGFSMTRTGYVMGTPFYMAPEQVLGKNIGPAVDVYAFGVLFFELLTGVRPVAGDTIERIFYAILNEPLDLAPLRGSFPQPICDLVARCTAKDPAERPPNFEAVAEEIARILAGMEPAALPPSGTPAVKEPIAKAPKAKAWMAVMLGIALLIAIVMLVKLLRAPAPLPPARNTPSGEMVLVPAGEFLYGKDKVSVTLPAFYIDKTEVTYAAYGAYCVATAKEFHAERPDHPMVNVTIADAREFARWAGQRLPTAQEWEKAARGADGQLFPWGNARDPGNANVRDNHDFAKHQIMQADSFRQGKSPYGALNMVGNVWEFVNQTAVPAPNDVQHFAKLSPPPGPQELWYEIRGESFTDDLTDGAIWDNGVVPARWTGSNIGFRCVMDAAPAH